MSIRLEMRGSALVATLCHSPVNTLSASVRQALMVALDRVEDDPAISVLLMASDLPIFSAGADIGEFAHAPVEPFLPDVLDRLAACRVPTVAVVAGKALGGGCELALACDYRLATANASFALPEVDLGLIPGAGGTQRLPRIVGIERAAEMIATGKPVDSKTALQWGLVDSLVAGDPIDDAIAFAKGLEATEKPVLAALGTVGEGWLADFSRTVTAKARGRCAPARAVEAVGLAATLPLAEGLAEERRIFAELKQGFEHKALRHAFKMKSELAKNPELEGVTPFDVQRVGIVGAGQMGSGIALALLDAGYDVLLYDKHAVEPGVERIRDGIARRVAKQRLSQEGGDAMLDRLHAVTSIEAMVGADLVIEAAIEKMEIKREIFGALEKVVGPKAVLATNTSYLDIDAMGEGLANPSRLVGMHFFNPADVMKLLEVIRADASSPQALATALAVGRKMGKVCVLARVCNGFVGNRIFKKYKEEAEFLVQEGADVATVDAVMRDFGFPMGPLQVCDLAGLDIGWHNRRREDATRGSEERYSDISDRLYEAGRMGRKSWMGWYRYEGRDALADDAVAALVAQSAQDAGITRRDIGEDEIRDRLLAVMIREGRAILAEGIVSRPIEVDAVLLNGYGFPAAKGGPMFWADHLGEDRVAAMIARTERKAAAAA